MAVVTRMPQKPKKNKMSRTKDSKREMLRKIEAIVVETRDGEVHGDTCNPLKRVYT